MPLELQDRELLSVVRDHPDSPAEKIAELAYPSAFKCGRTGATKSLSSIQNAVGRTRAKLLNFQKMGLVETEYKPMFEGRAAQRQHYTITESGKAQAK